MKKISSENIILTGGISRRHMLFGMSALLAQAGFWSSPLLAHAQNAQPVQPQAASNPQSADFLLFSQKITGHNDVNPVTADRIYDALQKNYPDFSTQYPKLISLLQSTNDPKSLLAAATTAGVHDLAYAIVTAWYTGTVGDGDKAVMVAYKEALMYRTVADGQTVPTYCNYGPLWWTGAPPPANVSAPLAHSPLAANSSSNKEVKAKHI